MASNLAVGLMSGTSADGVTAALVRFTPTEAAVIRCRTLSYSSSLRNRVLAASTLTAPDLSRLNMELGAVFAAAARAVMAGQRPAVIGSHGQTVWHGPAESPRNTLQLAEPAVIAERTGVTVVADFRPRDIAAGGQGAPLMPAFDEFLFGAGPMRAILNIGGLANVTFVGRGRLHAGFDTGPGNCLMDLAVRTATSGRLMMDRDGRLAARGRADEAKVAAMLRDAYFAKKPPKSLERTYFGKAFLKARFGRVSERKLPDVLATLNLFTAASIELALAMRKKGLREIVVSGGGALNPVLMANLRSLAEPVPVTDSADHGIPPMAKEAACFAWLALRAVRGQTNNCPAATGARGPRILGKIVPA